MEKKKGMEKRKYLILCFTYGSIMFLLGLSILLFELQVEFANSQVVEGFITAAYIIITSFLILLGAFLIKNKPWKAGVRLIKIGGYLQIPIGLFVATANLKEYLDLLEQDKRKTLNIAIASLVCSLLFLCPILGPFFSLVAVILGIIALGKISKNKDTLKGKGLAIGGITLGVAAILFYAACFTLG